MRARLALAGLALAGVLALPSVGAPAGAAIAVSSSRARVATSLGREFDFATTIANDSAAPSEPLVAHLNILSLRPGVYVDPEDWSSQRTQYLAPIPAGGSRTLGWRVKAVNGGSLAAYVAVLPRDASSSAPATSPVVRFTVTSRRTLNAGGIVPLAAGIPALLALLALGVRIKRRRRSKPTAAGAPRTT